MILVTMPQDGVRKLCKKWVRQCGSGNCFSQMGETVGFNATMSHAERKLDSGYYVRSGREWDSGNYVRSGRKLDSAMSEVGFCCARSGIQLICQKWERVWFRELCQKWERQCGSGN